MLYGMCSFFVCWMWSLYGSEPVLPQQLPSQQEAASVLDAPPHQYDQELVIADETSPLPEDAAADATANDKSIERMLAIIKPHVIERHLIGRIISLIEDNGFTIVALKLHQLTKDAATAFYQEHADKPFFTSLVDMMSSSPTIAMVLERAQGVEAWRELAGATNPAHARLGTIRAMYGESAERNAVHGSDSRESAAREIALIFPELVVSPAVAASAESAPSSPVTTALKQEAQPRELSHAEALALLTDEPEREALLDEDDALSLTLPEIAQSIKK